ncbi:cilia- and flagella-associated protein 70-like isoform X4 [Littorina saxatilis]|uniref:cilia- and flagella-associated protein 70-like isoform X4 n=1 Tax=Littorina saxatilis TaxID=31220 RepID=UPI0038B528A5
MAEAEAIHVRPPEPIVITVCRAHNLVQYSDTDRVSKCGSQLNMRGSKGDAVNVMVKVEFNEKVLGETPKVDCSPDVPAEFNFSTTLNCTYEDPLALDEIAHKPVVLTVIEVMPKERRQKEEKTSTLGQCTLDLLPLVKGETNYRYTLVINPTPGSPLEAIPAENPRPELDVMLSVNEALLDEQQIKDGNLLTITVESLFSPPDSWQLTGQQFYYSAALPVPCNSEDPTEKKEMLVVFPGGQLKLGADKELPNKQKKWAVPGSAVGNSIFIPDSVIASDPVEDEDGDFKDKGDRDHRHLSESEKMRITWNTERRCYLENAAVKGFQDSVAKTRYWPIEIFRFPQPAGGKGKKLTSKLKDEEGTISYHGVAFLNLAPLLYPGVKRIRGAFKVLPYTDHLLHEKSKRKAGIGEEALRLSLNQLNRSSASPAPKKAGKEKAEAEKKDAKKGASNTLKSDTGSEIDGQVPVNVEGQQYADSKSYIMIDICLTRPLVPKRPPEELARRVAELIPPRPAFPKRTDSADKAVEDYHCQIAGVASLLLEEFREMFGEDQGTGEPQTNEVMEGRRQKLMYHLNSSGKYFSFKEQLKHSVIKIVREKYLKTTNFDDRQQLQTFLSELYVYLVDQMHQSLNKVLQIEDQPPIPPPLTTNAQLKHFAREAEVNKNFDLATKYYQERIIREESNADNWFDFGTFCLYTNNVSKAEECFHKCISINQRHMDGLMLNGVVCTLAERNEAAETFFEAATNVDPKNILAWTMLGLFYDTISNDIGAEMAYLEANKLNIGQAASIARDEEQEKEKKEKEKAERAEKDGEATDTPQVEGDEELMIGSSEGGLSVPALDIKQPTPVGERTPFSARSSNIKGEKRNSAGKRASAVKLASPESPQKGGSANSAKSAANSKGSAINRRISVGSIVPPLSAGKSLTPSRPGSQLKEPARGTPVVGEAEAQEELPPREPTPIPAMSIYMQAVDWLLEVKAVPFTEQALAHELLTTPSGKTPAYHIATARVKLQKEEYEEAEQSLNDALQVEHQNPDGWALMGHVKYLNGDNHAARECYQRTLSFVTDATETHSIYLRLASIYLQDGEYQQAKQTFLMACKKSPSCVSWLGVGIACYRLGELGEAEDALMEANILNNSDPEVWGYLSLVCLRTARKVEAEQSYKHAVKLQLQDAALLNEIHAEQKKATFGNPEF